MPDINERESNNVYERRARAKAVSAAEVKPVEKAKAQAKKGKSGSK